jgi:hypothetical protein
VAVRRAVKVGVERPTWRGLAKVGIMRRPASKAARGPVWSATGSIKRRPWLAKRRRGRRTNKNSKRRFPGPSTTTERRWHVRSSPAGIRLYIKQTHVQ